MGNYNLVCEWALQNFQRNKKYTEGEEDCCRINSIIFGLKRQEQNFNVFYPLWIPDPTQRDSYLEMLNHRLHQQFVDKIHSIQEKEMYDKV
jgi:hypothetical protein